MGANSLIVDSTILAYGATEKAFPYDSSTDNFGVKTPWYEFGEYWMSGSTYDNPNYTPPSTWLVKSGYYLATEKGLTQNRQTSMAMVYVITVTCGDNGDVEGGGKVISGGSKEIEATANTHYAFSQWNDGNTSNPRTLSGVGDDETYTATFVRNMWQLYATKTAGGIISFTWTSGTYYTAGTKKLVKATRLIMAILSRLKWGRQIQRMKQGLLRQVIL